VSKKRSLTIDVEKAKRIPITKPWKENRKNISKYCPISLLKVRGKVLEKVLYTELISTFFSYDLINNNQYGFTPQRGTIYAAIAVKNFVEKCLVTGEVIVLVSLDAKGAFDAA
jgi:hypothetical protein